MSGTFTEVLDDLISSLWTELGSISDDDALATTILAPQRSITAMNVDELEWDYMNGQNYVANKADVEAHFIVSHAMPEVEVGLTYTASVEGWEGASFTLTGDIFSEGQPPWGARACAPVFCDRDEDPWPT